MSTRIEGTSRIFTSDSEALLARDVLATLAGEDGFLAVGEQGGRSEQLPREIGLLLQQVIMAIANGETVTVTSMPEDLTTTAAASLLGVSRPTLMKLIEEGELNAHRVGSHHRLNSQEVLAFRRARRDRERAAFRALLEAEADEE